MARRRRNDEWIWPLAQIFGLFVALGSVFPPFRQAAFGVGWVFVLVVVLAIGVIFSIGIYKLLSRKGTPGPHSMFQTTPAPPTVSAPLSPVIHPIRAAGHQTTSQLIDQLRSIDWFQFEQLVALIYRKQGYVVSRRGGAKPDGGIDLVIESDGVRTAVQCKHWKTWNVGVKTVREFLGALTDSGMRRGLLITLGGYTGEAKQLADKHRIEFGLFRDLLGVFH